jgi:hypothetical protein
MWKEIAYCVVNCRLSSSRAKVVGLNIGSVIPICRASASGKRCDLFLSLEGRITR